MLIVRKYRSMSAVCEWTEPESEVDGKRRGPGGVESCRSAISISQRWNIHIILFTSHGICHSYDSEIDVVDI